MADNNRLRSPEWNDDQRMSVLFSPFRNREVNPKSYEKKLDFWREQIYNECKEQQGVSFSTSHLPKMFERNGKQPHCMDTVIIHLLSKGKILKLEDFRWTDNSGWLSWGFNWLVKKPVSWTYRSLFKSENTAPQGDYVVLDLVKDKSEEVLQRLLSDTSSQAGVIEYTSLLPLICDICKDEMTTQLVLVQLQKDHKITMSLTEKGAKVIKFVTSSSAKVEAMTDTEMKIHRLNSVVPQLEQHIQQLMEDIQRCRLDAKYLLNQGLKSSAKNSLRRKRVFEGVLHKRENALENVFSLIQQIKDADTNKMIFEAYTAGTSAYKEKVKDLTPDNIDNVMIGLQETLDMESEINSAISQSIEHPDEVPISELEDELDALLAADSEYDDTTASPGMRSLVQGFEGLNVNSPGATQFPEVPKFDPSSPPPVTPPRKAQSEHAESTPQITTSSRHYSDIQLPSPPRSLDFD